MVPSGANAILIGGAPEQAASQRRDVAGSKLDALSQAPSPGPQPPAPAHPNVKTASYGLHMHRAAKTMFSEHVMCAMFCVLLRAVRVEKKNLVVTMDSQAA